MPLDFNTTKDFRDNLLKRTLNPVYGRSPSPKTFTSTNYSVQSLSDSSNLLLPNVDGNRSNDLLTPQKSNIFKPNEYFIKDSFQDIPRRANLSLYPYFIKSDNNLVGIMLTKNYDTESELFKFAANNIRTNPQGPVLARISQNLYTATNAKNKIGEALAGNTNTLINIIRGKQPLIEGNESITVSSSLLGKGFDFLQTVAGTQLPFSTIPGDYLTNPRNPINTRPTDVSKGTKVWQDLTGVLGSIVGIQRRPLPSRKPSDILIEHMGSSSKNRLFDLLSYSKYSPNYTTTARSQMSTGLGKFPSQVAQGFKSLLGMEAPNSGAYIGDDREKNVKQATTDLFSGRPTRSSYYLTLMYDKVSAELFHNTKSIIENGPIGGNLTWISKNRTSKSDITGLGKTKSTDFTFRPDSILNVTQQILDSKPQNGGDALAHIGHVLDQTSKFFKDGDTYISRGSGVKYMDNSGRDIGVEYARVWTKNRPYFKYGDTMPLYKETTKKPYYKGATGSVEEGKEDTTNSNSNFYRRTGIRRFDGSVMTNTWNLNMAPMSDGTSNREFPGSSNIVKGEKGFYAKKYMLSIENLAWASSTLPGFTVNDLPYSERGPNGGRVMWFPPYDLKVSEQNSAKWEPNTFLGRPEPIYTYQNSERNGTIGFKVIVDHPSILNLLVREHFKSVNETDVDAYINAFFAGAKDIDFYSLIRQYSHLESDDIKMIQNYLGNGGDPSDIQRFKNGVSSVVKDSPDGTSTQDANKDTVNKKLKLVFPNDQPLNGDSNTSKSNYETLLLSINKTESETSLRSALTNIIIGTTLNDLIDCVNVFGKGRLESSESGSTINKVATDLQSIFTANDTATSDMLSTLETLKTDLDNKNTTGDIIILINSTTSKAGDDKSNYQLSVRRSHAIYLTVLNKLKVATKWNFKKLDSQLFADGKEVYVYENQFKLTELGYAGQTGNLIIRTTNYGSNANLDNDKCSKINYNNKDLVKFIPLSYGCRSSILSIKYDKTKKVDTPINGSVNTKLNPTGAVSTNKTKPTIDVMKRIIMKTLSEEFYFKKLEESSPMIYSSLKEKLRYFHPGFHSMTPEGLNSRLTFLQQCLRPGDTIPIKGLSDNSDINARNTTFGPPPVCVLRVGDFYNSKVIIKDLNIQFEQNVWDLNPEGIGIQPMIADVTMQITFLGGQGLEKPVERLQNALSSNFFANTEMYDERSISTNTKMGGKDANKFTREFIQSLSDTLIPQTGLKDSNGKGLIEGQHIGLFGSSSTNGGPKINSLNYKSLVSNLYEETENYFKSYPDMYNNILTTYGPLLTNLLINKDYRVLKTYNGGTMGNINFFGLYKSPQDLSYMVNWINSDILKYLNEKYVGDKYYILDMLKIKDLVPQQLSDYFAESIHNYIINNLIDKLNTMLEIPSVKKFTRNRDDLIKILDKVKFILDNGYDVKIDNGKTYKSTFTTPIDFYSSVKPCIDYINENTNKMYSKLDTSINFLTPIYNDSLVQDIIQTFYYNDRTNIINELLKVAQSNIDVSVVNGINNKLIKVFYKASEVNIKFQKSPKPKNDNAIKYIINSEILDTTTDEIKEIFSGNIKIENKLT